MVEFERFGWNAVTASFLVALLTIALNIWGLWEQNRTIWRGQTGKSVSVVRFTFATAFFVASVIYGLEAGRLALVCNALRFPLLIAILVGLHRFKGFSRTDRILIVLFAAGVVMMAFVPFKDWYFLAMCVGAWLTCVDQIVEIARNRDSGAVNVRTLWVAAATIVVWVVYGFAVRDWVMMWTNPVHLLLIGVNLVVWYAYRRPCRIT